MRRPLLATLVLAAATVGCFRESDIIDIDDDAVAVHAMLQAGADSAVILITRADDDLLTPPDYRPVTGAQVRLIHGADTTWLVEVEARSCVFNAGSAPVTVGAGCYRAELPGPIASGQDYSLEIVLPNGDRVTGATRVPSAPEILRPAAGARIPTACGHGELCFGREVQGPPFVLPVARFPVRWSQPPTAGRAQVVVSPHRVVFDGVEYSGDSCFLGSRNPLGTLVTDSIDWPVPNISCGAEPLSPARFDSIITDVVVTALDPGYERYLETVLEGSSVRASSVREGLDGAYGVFGAAAASSRRIVLVRDPPAARPPAAPASTAPR